MVPPAAHGLKILPQIRSPRCDMFNIGGHRDHQPRLPVMQMIHVSCIVATGTGEGTERQNPV